MQLICGLGGLPAHGSSVLASISGQISSNLAIYTALRYSKKQGVWTESKQKNCVEGNRKFCAETLCWDRQTHPPRGVQGKI